ncbi:MAG: PLP-dependent transferase [Candidatus Thermoplasmatota archaeon]|nr:PLP-dependent transferase [Candidatus Thermoplasmatota archaeon]
MKEQSKIVRDKIEGETGSIIFPIYQSSAFQLPKGERFRYSRENNPSVEALCQKINELEGSEAGNCFSSGMGAVTTTLLSLLSPGKTILVQRDIFARTYKFITQFLQAWGVKVIIADPGTQNILKFSDRKVDLIFVESLTNPTLRITDIEAIRSSYPPESTTIVTDATFATPVLQKPLSLGSDIVIHSLSKFMSGHNDTIGGYAGGRKELMALIDQNRRTLGPSMDPNTAFLINRGMKTLFVRMKQSGETAYCIARSLQKIDGVKNVLYPLLENHPDYATSGKVLKGKPSVVSFELDNSRIDIQNFMSSLNIIMPANTLGGLNTTITHPSTMSHRTISGEERLRAGISPELVRLSVGLESEEDLLGDLEASISTNLL